MGETGHIKNLENLGIAIDFATSWGVKYAPSNPMLDIAAMSAKLSAGEAEMDTVQTNKTPYRNATAACEDAFDPLSKLTTRIMKTMKASGIPESVQEDAATYARKIKGQRKTPKVVDDPATPDVDESDKSHSASQMSRTQRIENFDALRSLLSSQPLYAPNENDLKNNALKGYSDDLKLKVAAVGDTFVPYSNSMASRDDVLYKDTDSVFQIGRLFKIYVEGAFTRNSSEWAQIKNLEFRDLRRK